MYIGVAMFVVGTGLTAPNSYALVGLCYYQHDIRRDSAFTIYYLLFNLGFLFSTTAGGYFVRYFGYSTTFLIAAFALLCALIIFCSSLKFIQPAPGSSMTPTVNWKSWQIILLFMIAGIVGIPLCVFLFEHVTLNNLLLWILAVGSCIGIIIMAAKQKEKLDKYKVWAFLILSIISIAFWALYMLEPSLLTVFIQKNVNRHIAGFIIPPSTYYGLDALFVIILGIGFSWLWKFLSKKNKDISLPGKFAGSLLSMGLGYLVIVLGIQLVGGDYLTNSSWIVLAYVLFASAELLISPIGLAMVGRLMPKGKDGLGMGIWQVFTGLSAVISGYLANMAVVPSTGEPLETNPIFAHALLKIGLGTIVVGIIAIILTPFIKRLILGTEKE